MSGHTLSLSYYIVVQNSLSHLSVLRQYTYRDLVSGCVTHFISSEAVAIQRTNGYTHTHTLSLSLSLSLISVLVGVQGHTHFLSLSALRQYIALQKTNGSTHTLSLSLSIVSRIEKLLFPRSHTLSLISSEAVYTENYLSLKLMGV